MKKNELIAKINERIRPSNTNELFYNHWIECTNCGKIEKFQILKGTLIADYTMNLRCLKCGCYYDWE